MIYTGIILTPLFSCMIKLFVLRGKAWPYSWCSKSSYVSRVLLVEIIIVRHTVYIVILVVCFSLALLVLLLYSCVTVYLVVYLCGE